MMQGIIEMSSRNQIIMLTPFTLAGAMAPVAIAGAVVQQNAEALAGIAFTQMVRAGAPVVYGGFTSNVDMKTGAPAFGTPEYMKAVLLGGQLCRKYGLPYRAQQRERCQHRGCPIGVRVGVLAVGAGARRRQVHHAQRGLAGGRPDRVV